MNKEKLKEAIEKIPKFRLRDIAVDKKEAHLYAGDYGWFKQEHLFAVTDVDNYKALCTVGKSYYLVQFFEIFNPIVDSMPDIDGELIYDNGFAYLFIFPEGEKYKEGNDEFGLVVVNSVNTTASVMIRFIVKHNGKKILLPKKISGFKRNHKGKNTLSMAQDYLYSIDKVKDTWRRIIKKFSTETLTTECIIDLNLGKKISKELMKKVEEDKEKESKTNLWDAFMYALEYISSKEYKTEVHKRKRLDKVCETIIEYGILMGI